MEPRRGVHPLVEVALLGVDVPVEVDDPDVAVQIRCHPADGRETDRVVPAQDDRHHAPPHDVGHRLADLVEGLLQVPGNGEHVPDVDQIELFAQVDAEFIGVGAEQVGRAPDTLRAEARAWPVGRPGVQWDPEDRYLGVADIVHILDIRAFQEGAPFAREVRCLPAGEGRDRTIGDRRRARQAMGEPALDLLLGPPGRQLCLSPLRPASFSVDPTTVRCRHAVLPGRHIRPLTGDAFPVMARRDVTP